uniref:ornithine aminotransferase n=1 Tax=viral metagenome TaxID=1070528 RepID=A0A6C0B448_9ZZZZ
MKRFIQKELQYATNNYNTLPVCIKSGSGVYLTDVNNKTYLDFISAYSAVNQGHCHPRLVSAMNKQSRKLTLTSRAIPNNVLGDFAESLSKTFKYDKVLPMNTGVEGGESAIKLARMWGYIKKGVDPNQAINLFCNNNFWGRTLAASSTSDDPLCYNNIGPYMNGFENIPFNDVESLRQKLEQNPNIVSIMLEPIQGEAGIIVPTPGYLSKVRKLCNQHNVLMIADEVQTGLGRTGKMLACNYEKIKPDILILGKALSGGMMPISAVLANNNIMEVMTPGTHGSTFGGNPLAAVIGMEALQIIKDENLIENSYEMGKLLRDTVNNFDVDVIFDCRGKGLLNAIEFENKAIASAVSSELHKNGLLAKTTHDTVLRLSPPLTITKKEMEHALDILYNCIKIIEDDVLI